MLVCAIPLEAPDFLFHSSNQIVRCGTYSVQCKKCNVPQKAIHFCSGSSDESCNALTRLQMSLTSAYSCCLASVWRYPACLVLSGLVFVL